MRDTSLVFESSTDISVKSVSYSAFETLLRHTIEPGSAWTCHQLFHAGMNGSPILEVLPFTFSTPRLPIVEYNNDGAPTIIYSSDASTL